jgi:hypothetical protein
MVGIRNILKIINRESEGSDHSVDPGKGRRKKKRQTLQKKPVRGWPILSWPRMSPGGIEVISIQDSELVSSR